MRLNTSKTSADFACARHNDACWVKAKSGYTAGRHFWELVFHRDLVEPTSDVGFYRIVEAGVCDGKATPSSAPASETGYVLMGNTKAERPGAFDAIKNGKPIADQAPVPGFVALDRVGFLLDMDKRTCEYWLNGKNQGVVFVDLPDKVFPCAGVQNRGSSVAATFDMPIPKSV